MARASTLNFEVTGMLDNAASQFRNLNPNEPGQWPTLPKAAAWVAAVALVVVGGWFLLLSAANDDLEASRRQEPKLKDDYTSRLRSAIADSSAAAIFVSAMAVRRTIRASAATLALATISSASRAALTRIVAISSPACFALLSYSALSASASLRSADA